MVEKVIRERFEIGYSRQKPTILEPTGNSSQRPVF